jgi:DNA recombination protein RmuC
MNTQTLLLIGTVLAALAVVLLIVLLLRRARGTALLEERDRLRSELQAEREARHGQTATLAREQERSVSRETEIAALQDRLRQGEERHGALLAEQRAMQQAKSSVEAELADLRVRLEHGEQARAEMRAFLEQAQERLSATFAELAGKTFASTVDESAKRSRDDIGLLLKPFAERIGDFRNRIDALYADEAKERAALAGAVNELKTLNQDMAQRAHELTRALRGNAKVRGDWGELMLESVLRSAGLEEGVHYERQRRTRDDDDRILQPDVVIRLPDERRIVVDSKVNLIAWQEAMNAESPEVQQEAMRRHAVALRQHVKDLVDRNYPRAMGDSALDVTLLFVPIEGALSAALGTDHELQTFAFERNVVFSSPNTLMAMLRVVDRLWTRDRLQRQALEISKAGGLLLDALSGFMDDFNKVDERLKQARGAYDDAKRRLIESPKSVASRAQRLVELGARGKRALPAAFEPEPENLGLSEADGQEQEGANLPRD